jgi:hypothetical protein
MTDAPTFTSSTDDVRVLDLLEASGMLNPNLTLDKLMDVTRQLAEIEPTTIIPGIINAVTINVFLHNQFCYVIAR